MFFQSITSHNNISNVVSQISEIVTSTDIILSNGQILPSGPRALPRLTTVGEMILQSNVSSWFTALGVCECEARLLRAGS